MSEPDEMSRLLRARAALIGERSELVVEGHEKMVADAQDIRHRVESNGVTQYDEQVLALLEDNLQDRIDRVVAHADRAAKAIANTRLLSPDDRTAIMRTHASTLIAAASEARLLAEIVAARAAVERNRER
jgi:hypothetical protein